MSDNDQLETNNTNSNLIEETVIIENGQTESLELNTQGAKLVGIRLPSAMTGTILSFKISDNAGSFLDYFNSAGVKLEIPITVDTHIGLLIDDFVPVQKIKIVSNSAEGAERTIIVILGRA